MACDAWWRFWCECRKLSRLRAGSSVVEISIAARMVTGSIPVSRLMLLSPLSGMVQSYRDILPVDGTIVVKVVASLPVLYPRL